MKGNPEQRCVELAQYIVKTESTVRKTAQVFAISKSTVHKDVAVRLRRQNPALWRKVQKILGKNKAERHLRGGAATKAKYCLKKEKHSNTSDII